MASMVAEEEQEQKPVVPLSFGDLAPVEQEASSERQTFKQRVISDFYIIKDNLKTEVVWRYYLYYLLAGLEPSFGGISYFWVKEVY